MEAVGGDETEVGHEPKERKGEPESDRMKRGSNRVTTGRCTGCCAINEERPEALNEGEENGDGQGVKERKGKEA